MSAPTGLSAPMFTYAHTHKQTNKQKIIKQPKQTPICLHLGLCRLTLRNKQSIKHTNKQTNTYICASTLTNKQTNKQTTYKHLYVIT